MESMFAFPRLSLFSFSMSTKMKITIFLKKNGPTPASFSLILGLFKQTLQFLQQIYVKNVHPVYGAGIRTHNLQNVSLFP